MATTSYAKATILYAISSIFDLGVLRREEHAGQSKAVLIMRRNEQVTTWSIMSISAYAA